MNVEHAESIEQVLAKVAALNGFAQIAVRRGDDTDVRLQQACPPEPLELALLQNAQELGLRGEAHFGDLVEKEHAARRELHLPGLCLLRAGERAALVAKQLRLEQLLGQCGAIQRDERPAPARRRGMDEPRHDFFAGAGLAGNEHGRVGRSDLCRLAQHRAPFGRLAHDTHVAPHGRLFDGSLHARVAPFHPVVVDLRDRSSERAATVSPSPRW